jgi:membrane protein DedA with SNARE-associated domain
LEAIARFVQQLIGEIGYPGILVLMALESTMVPIPSELVMPFAGYLAFKGDFSLPMVILMNTLGAIIGSLACYAFAARAGKPVLLRYRRWLFINVEHLEKTEAFFARHGSATVFVARLIPVVRHFISLVAGLGRMNPGKFLLQTILGSTLWGGFLSVLGYELGANWESVAKSVKRFDLILGLAIIGVGVYFFVRHRKKVLAERRAREADSTAEDR